MFLRGRCQDVISNGESQFLVDFFKGDYEAVESQLLEAVAKEGLVKTQQAGKKVSGCCDNL
jgi:hypothetical protein